ncbi:MAG: hypothetical protein SFU20_00890 [Chitinophagaceae bacterium]|nr:hypothetical protein [Chitinophagaceae bacterium]
MWTGKATLYNIHSYISGYYQALLDNKIVQKIHTDEPFFNWVAIKLGYNESTAGWENMILADCMGFKPENTKWEEIITSPVTGEQHLKSINFFYELLEQFKNDIENHD